MSGFYELSPPASVGGRHSPSEVQMHIFSNTHPSVVMQEVNAFISAPENHIIAISPCSPVTASHSDDAQDLHVALFVVTVLYQEDL